MEEDNRGAGTQATRVPAAISIGGSGGLSQLGGAGERGQEEMKIELDEITLEKWGSWCRWVWCRWVLSESQRAVLTYEMEQAKRKPPEGGKK